MINETVFLFITYNFLNSIGFLHTMAAILRMKHFEKKKTKIMNNNQAAEKIAGI